MFRLCFISVLYSFSLYCCFPLETLKRPLHHLCLFTVSDNDLSSKMSLRNKGRHYKAV